MKVAITTPFTTEPIVENERQSVSINNIQNIPQSSCDSIYMTDSLDFISVQSRSQILMQIVQKLRYGGELIVRGLDIIEASRRVFTKDVGVGAAQQIFYNNRQSAESLDEVSKVLRTLGLEIVNSNLDTDMFYHVEARRPNA